MAGNLTVAVRLRIAWWVRPFLWCCAVFARLHGVEPDPDKVAGVLKRGIKVEVT